VRSFVLFSSASALLGTPGQASYAAGNAFLAALAHERRRQGRPAVCIDWGPWSGGGMAAAQDARSSELWQAQGIGELTPEVGLAALELALQSGATELLALPLDSRRLAVSDLGREPLFTGIAGGDKAAVHKQAAGSGLREEILAASQAEAAERMTAYLRGLVGATLHLDPATLDDDRRINQLGMDSLTVMELRNRLKSDLRVDIPAVALFEYPTVRELAGVVLSRLAAAPAPAPSAAAAAPTAAAPTAPVQVDQLSDDEVEIMLRRLLEEGGG